MAIEARVGNLDGDLEEVISRYSHEFGLVPGILNPYAKKYAYFQEESQGRYMIMVSHGSLNKQQGLDYDMILTVMGHSQETAKAIADDFEKKTGNSLRQAPEHLKKTYNAMALMVTPTANRPDKPI